MSPVVDMSAFFADAICNRQNYNHSSTDDYLKLVRKQTENRLLNTQALIEYRLLKARLISGVSEGNKFFELDDQIIVQEYKFCTSLSYRKRVFVMEFRQIGIGTNECNHALELIFRTSLSDVNNGWHSTLILAKENRQFVWRPLHSVQSGPFGSSRSLVALIMHWLQNDKNSAATALYLT